MGLDPEHELPEDISPTSPYISLYLPYISQVGLDPEHELPEDISPISPLYLPYISQVGLDPEHELPEERYAARVTLKVNT